MFKDYSVNNLTISQVKVGELRVIGTFSFFLSAIGCNRRAYTYKCNAAKDLLFTIQRLRTENRLLRQRVDLLEQESSDLADRLIQGQVRNLRIESYVILGGME